MKRLHKITAALAGLALAAGAFTSCADSHTGDDWEPVAVPTHIVGGFKQADVDGVTAEDKDSNDFFPLTFEQDDDGYQVATFTWKQDSNKWAAGFPTDTQAFQLTLGLSWDSVWKNGEALTLNSDYEKVVFAANGGNITVSGLSQGEEYTMKIKVDGSAIMVKVEGKEEAFTELTLIADGIPYTMDRLNNTYTKSVKSSGTSISFVIYDGETTWGKDSITLGTEYTYAKATKPSTIATEEGFDYEFTATLTDSGAPKVTVAKGKVKVYIAGAEPLNWSIGTDNALLMTQIGESTTYYYTFEAKSAATQFKVATKNTWGDAYSNCQNDDGEAKTPVGNDWIEYSYANGQNAEITGLTVGETYTVVVDIANATNPKVRVYYGEARFIVGNGDFGNWYPGANKDKCTGDYLMVSTTKNEWTYTFTARKADAAFKFLGDYTKWDDNKTWSTEKEDTDGKSVREALTIGGAAVNLKNGGGLEDLTANLTVGTQYVVTLTLDGTTYKAKIAEKIVTDS